MFTPTCCLVTAHFFVSDGNRGVTSSKQVRGPQHNNIMLTITNVNQDIGSTLKQDKSEGAMVPLGPIVATPVDGNLSKGRM